MDVFNLKPISWQTTLQFPLEMDDEEINPPLSNIEVMDYLEMGLYGPELEHFLLPRVENPEIGSLPCKSPVKTPSWRLIDQRFDLSSGNSSVLLQVDNCTFRDMLSLKLRSHCPFVNVPWEEIRTLNLDEAPENRPSLIVKRKTLKLLGPGSMAIEFALPATDQILIKWRPKYYPEDYLYGGYEKAILSNILNIDGELRLWFSMLLRNEPSDSGNLMSWCITVTPVLERLDELSRMLVETTTSSTKENECGSTDMNKRVPLSLMTSMGGLSMDNFLEFWMDISTDVKLRVGTRTPSGVEWSSHQTSTQDSGTNKDLRQL